jgi:hypothetical protein
MHAAVCVGSAQAHCHLDLGALYATEGQVDRAYIVLSTAMAMYRAMAMALWQPRAEAVLNRLEKQ